MRSIANHKIIATGCYWIRPKRPFQWEHELDFAPFLWGQPQLHDLEKRFLGQMDGTLIEVTMGAAQSPSSQG